MFRIEPDRFNVTLVQGKSGDRISDNKTNNFSTLKWKEKIESKN